jgi:hypothetical protein
MSKRSDDSAYLLLLYCSKNYLQIDLRYGAVKPYYHGAKRLIDS